MTKDAILVKEFSKDLRELSFEQRPEPGRTDWSRLDGSAQVRPPEVLSRERTGSDPTTTWNADCRGHEQKQEDHMKGRWS